MEKVVSGKAKLISSGTGKRAPRRMAVLCPSCSERICDVPSGSHMVQYLEGDEDRPEVEPELYVKCRKCGAELFLYKMTG